jgi:hypothetical protein
MTDTISSSCSVAACQMTAAITSECITSWTIREVLDDERGRIINQESSTTYHRCWRSFISSFLVSADCRVAFNAPEEAFVSDLSPSITTCIFPRCEQQSHKDDRYYTIACSNKHR